MSPRNELPSSTAGFRCPTCNKPTIVVDSRWVPRGMRLRRRRECPDKHRFTTFEEVATDYILDYQI